MELDLSRPYPIDTALALASAAQDEASLAREIAADHELLRNEALRLRAQLDKPCGECHPCLYWADQTWRAAGRTPPDMPLWDEKVMDLAHAEAELEEERRSAAALREQISFLTFERDRLRDELGEVCEERERLRTELRGIGQTVTRSGRRLAFEDGGGSHG